MISIVEEPFIFIFVMFIKSLVAIGLLVQIWEDYRIPVIEQMTTPISSTIYYTL